MSVLTQWRDATSYSRDDQERKPTSYSIKHGWLNIYITCGHIHYQPNWILHCHALGIDTKGMSVSDGDIQCRSLKEGDDLNIVKARAIGIVEARIDEIRDDIIVIKRGIK